MHQRIRKPRLLASTLLVAVIAAVALSLVLVYVQDDSPPSNWPALTVTYEIGGEVLELDYTSKDAWTETVTEAPSITTNVGTFSNVGSYQKVQNGNYIT